MTLSRQPGVAVVHFRRAGSDACDSVAAILAQLVRAYTGRLPLTKSTSTTGRSSLPGITSGPRRQFS